MQTPEEMQKEWGEEIAKAGVPTEKEMRETKAPTPDTPEELVAYINSLVDRPHDYGTCVYAMSLSAAAAFNYVARKLGVTGFQASCADLAFLGQTRGFKWGKILDYENLLFPQYCNDEKFPTWRGIIEENREEFAKRAREKLSERGKAHPNVRKHWEWLASLSNGNGTK